ncbi:MAG: threonine/serine dehydratase [bacterium]
MCLTKIPLENFIAAKEKIRSYIRSTPLEYARELSQRTHSRIYLKLENWQKTGSFKIRGAVNKLLSLSAEEKQKGVITASAGNHGLGVAFTAQMMGVPGKIVVPETASTAKIKALEHYDLELIKQGIDYDEAEQIAWQVQKRENRTFIHAFSDPDIIAGQGTIGLEILHDLPDVETILVPIGGGGLISGVAIAAKSLKPNVKIIGVQSEASPAMYNSVQSGKIVETPIADTLADGLAGRFVTELTLNITQHFVDEICLVSEDAIKAAVKLILESEHMLIEGSAAVGVAALLENKIALRGEIVIVVTGRNIAVKQLKNIF